MVFTNAICKILFHQRQVFLRHLIKNKKFIPVIGHTYKTFSKFKPWPKKTTKISPPKFYKVQNEIGNKFTDLKQDGFQKRSPSQQETIIENHDSLEILRRYNASGDYNKAIELFESIQSNALQLFRTFNQKDNDLIVEYFKALLNTNQIEKLLKFKRFSDDLNLSSDTKTKEFRLRLEDNKDQPLRVSLKPMHRLSYFLYDLLKYSISILLCISAISLVIERVAENLPQGLGFAVGKKVDPVIDIKETLDDVKGCDEVKQELQEILEYLSDPKKFVRLGARLPKGILLAGEPGTGKTLLARSIAGEAKVPFIQASATEFEEMFVGVGARRIRDLFESAHKIAPVIIFIDEIDAVGSRRAAKDSSSARMTLNQLLVELDGFRQNEGIVVICATNSPESLDPALTRPGRLDKTIHVPLPDLQGRLEILNHFAKRVVLSKDANMKSLARLTVGMTGADLSNVINIAAVRSAARNEKCISMKALESALDRVVVGLERRNPMSLDERKLTSIHEAGHAIAGWFTPGADPVYKATIMPRGASLGVTWNAPETDRYQKKLFEMEAQLIVSMAGRAAEELLYGSKNVTSGSSSDLKSATLLAKQMVMQYGFGLSDGKISIYLDGSSQLSDTHRDEIDTAVQKFLNDAYDKALNVLKKYMAELLRLSEALLEFETMSREEIQLAIKGNASEIANQRKMKLVK